MLRINDVSNCIVAQENGRRTLTLQVLRVKQFVSLASREEKNPTQGAALVPFCSDPDGRLVCLTILSVISICKFLSFARINYA